MDINLLIEAPLPDNWNKKKFKDDVPFIERVRYAASKKVRLLGAGSSRIAVDVNVRGYNCVIKFALNKIGYRQNAQEIEMLTDPSIKATGLFVGMLDYDRANSNISWLQVEKCSPVGHIGEIFNREDFDRFKRVIDHIPGSGHTPHEMLSFEVEDGQEFSGDIAKRLVKFLLDNEDKCDMLFNFDLFKKANWGKIKNRYVILDCGFNDGMIHTLYNDPDNLDAEADEAAFNWKMRQDEDDWDGNVDDDVTAPYFDIQR